LYLWGEWARSLLKASQ